MGTTYVDAIKLSTTSCCSCGLVFAIPDDFRNELKKNGKSFYCPGCKNGMWYGEGEADKLRKTLRQQVSATERAQALAQRRADERDTAERRRRGQQAAKTRVMNRIKRGECPCCGETFANLHAHMTTKHPDYAEKA